MWTHSWLQTHHCLTPDAVVIAFNLAEPSASTGTTSSTSTRRGLRRAYVAAYHLERGSSRGSRRRAGSACSATRATAAGSLPQRSTCSAAGRHAGQPVARPGGLFLPTIRPDLDLRGIIIAVRQRPRLARPGPPLRPRPPRLDEVPQPLQPQGRVAPLLRRPAPEQSPPRHRPDRPDPTRLRPSARSRRGTRSTTSTTSSAPRHNMGVRSPRIGRWIATCWAPDPGPIIGRIEAHPYGSGPERVQRAIRDPGAVATPDRISPPPAPAPLSNARGAGPGSSPSLAIAVGHVGRRRRSRPVATIPLPRAREAHCRGGSNLYAPSVASIRRIAEALRGIMFG